MGTAATSAFPTVRALGRAAQAHPARTIFTGSLVTLVLLALYGWFWALPACASAPHLFHAARAHVAFPSERSIQPFGPDARIVLVFAALALNAALSAALLLRLRRWLLASTLVLLSLLVAFVLGAFWEIAYLSPVFT